MEVAAAVVTAAAALVLIAAAWYTFAPRRAPAGQPPLATMDLAELRAEFNRASDRPRLFVNLADAITAAGGNVVGARVFTSRTGQALDVFYVQDVTGQPLASLTVAGPGSHRGRTVVVPPGFIPVRW